VFGVGYLAMVVIFASAVWAGSFTTMWRDMSASSPAYAVLLALALAHLATAAFAFRFIQRSASSRALALFGAAVLFAATIYSSAIGLWVLLRGHVPVDLPAAAVALQICRPLIYG